MDNLRLLKQEVQRIISDAENNISWNEDVIERWSKERRDVTNPKKELRVYTDILNAMTKIKTKHSL